MSQLKVEQLFLYPVKSLHGVPLEAMTLDDFGPAGDRRWMVVDADGRFMTQREQPLMARVHAALGHEGLELTIPGQSAPIRVRTGDRRRNVLVWRDWVRAEVAEAEASAALSEWLGQPVELAYMPESTVRPVDHHYVTSGQRVSFADGFPLLITHVASLESLSERIGEPVDMRRFRPNIVVSGGDPFAEDRWASLSGQGVTLTPVKPCSRCLMTTVDPDEGVRADDLQPLRELGRFRRTANGVMFGVNAVHSGPGQIRVGDIFDVEFSEDH